MIAEPDRILEHIKSLIGLTGAFADAGDDCVRSLAEVVSWSTIPGGNTLFSQGEPSTKIYITSSGLLGAYTHNSLGQETLVGRIGSGELIGEMGCVAGETRSATIRALRTSQVLEISWEAIEPLARAHPSLMFSLCRTVIGRLRGVMEGKRPQIGLRTFCLLPHGEDQVIRTFVDDLVFEFCKLGSSFLVTKEICHDYTTDQLLALEASYDYVLYLAENDKTPWSKLCLNQADSVLIITQGQNTPLPIDPFSDVSAEISKNLVLLWPGKILSGKTGPWLDSVRPRAHYHVRSVSDVGRAARLLTGKGLGIVLAGGGARGLAHIGVMRAFAEHGIEIDAVVGTSIGALVGSSIAMEWNYPTSRNMAREFSRRHPLWELVLPLRSLLSGRNLRISLERWYGATEIEETPIPYACVSTSLNTSGASVHLRGKLKTWVRASASLPGIFPPVLENGIIYVDGGVMNNLPTDTIHGMGVGFVIAVELGSGDRARARTLPSIIDVLMRVATLGSDARNLSARHQCDVLLNPNLETVELLDFRAYDLAMQIGHDCALEKIEQIKLRIPDKTASNASSPFLTVGLPVSGKDSD